MTSIITWHRCYRAPGLGGVAATGVRGRTYDMFITGIPAWPRRSNAPGCEGIAATEMQEERRFGQMEASTSLVVCTHERRHRWQQYTAVHIHIKHRKGTCIGDIITDTSGNIRVNKRTAVHQ